MMITELFKIKSFWITTILECVLIGALVYCATRFVKIGEEEKAGTLSKDEASNKRDAVVVGIVLPVVFIVIVGLAPSSKPSLA